MDRGIEENIKILSKDLATCFNMTAKMATENIDNALRGNVINGKDLTIKLESNPKEEVESSQWLDLDIDNLPEKFFTREDIEIERYFVHQNSWNKFEVDAKVKLVVIGNMLRGSEYRYRIKPLESIRITRELYNYLHYRFLNENTGLNADYNNKLVKAIDGRKVEIIN